MKSIQDPANQQPEQDAEFVSGERLLAKAREIRQYRIAIGLPADVAGRVDLLIDDAMVPPGTALMPLAAMLTDQLMHSLKNESLAFVRAGEEQLTAHFAL